jgi:hypothetical protein
MLVAAFRLHSISIKTVSRCMNAQILIESTEEEML